MAHNETGTVEFAEQDIIFECPNCSKSLGIDARGAGLMVTCPDCSLRMQVPVPDQVQGADVIEGCTSVADYTATTVAAASERAVESTKRLDFSMDDLQQRKNFLEKQQKEIARKIERVREEMATIQAALDRMTDIFQ